MYQIFIILIILIIFLCLYNIKMNEGFLPFDSEFNYNSCKNLINEQKKVNLLTNIYCNKENNSNNRTEINLNEKCYDNTTRKILLDVEKHNWCSRLSNDEKKILDEELLQTKEINEFEINGPEFMDKQYYHQENIVPWNNNINSSTLIN